MSSIKLKHSGGNSVIIAAPSSNPASDRTLTVPSNADGTILTTTSPKAGNIIQVLQTVKTDTFSTNSTSYTDITGLSVAITPTSTSSKILVTFHINLGHTNYVSGFVRLMRDSTAISVGDASGSRIVATVAMSDDPVDDEINCYSATFLDSPSTTSATTYKLQITTEAAGNTGDVFINRSGEDSNNVQHSRVVSSITVMEVAA
jgi:hypothetical protein